MTKKTEAEQEPEQPHAGPPPGGRRGRYIGTSGRRFESSPFGGQLVPKNGEVVTVGPEFEYLWTDPNFSVLFEWEGEAPRKH